MTRLCSIDGCTRVHCARGWCSTHYKRWSTHGDPMREVPPGRQHPPTIWFCECTYPIIAGFGECQTCYRKPRALMNLEPVG